MGSKSKIKGKSFEREVCKYLSNVYGDNFQRVFDSGAFTGGKNTVRKQNLSENQIRFHKGDIIPPDTWKYFNCECKFYSEFPFHLLFGNNKIALLETWIKQTKSASDKDDCNVIIIKINRKGRFIAVNSIDFEYDKCINYTDNEGETWVFSEFESFLVNNKSTFKERCENLNLSKYQNKDTNS